MTPQHIKKLWPIVLVFAVIGIGTMVLFLAPSLLTHLFVRSKAELVRSPKDIENALLVLKKKKSQFLAPHIVFKIFQQPHTTWRWHANRNGAGVGRSWAQGDRIIEFAKVGDDMR
jgi:hypothetical protein